MKSKFIGRDSRLDVKEGIVAIDFGTKSTVVAYQNEYDLTMPMRVGIGKLKKKIEPKHFENPTSMEFIDLESFLATYRAGNGRPKTKWNTLTISHIANDSLHNAMSEHY